MTASIQIPARQFFKNILSDITGGDANMVTEDMIYFLNDWIKETGGAKEVYPVNLQDQVVAEFYGR